MNSGTRATDFSVAFVRGDIQKVTIIRVTWFPSISFALRAVHENYVQTIYVCVYISGGNALSIC